MEKFLGWLYYCTLGLFISGVIYLTLALYLSPRQDALKRGFIPCTKQLVADLNDCPRGAVGCPIALFWQDTKCNINVIFLGWRAWLQGAQSTPWDNYFFKAVKKLPSDPKNSLNDNFTDLTLSEEFLAEKHDELDAAKQRRFNLNNNVLISNPEIQEKLPKITQPKTINTTIESDNIDEEAFMEEIATDVSIAKPDIKTDSMLQHKKLQQINQEKIKGNQNEQ